MAHETTASSKLVGIPLSVVSPVDVSRLLRELEAIDNTLLEQNLREQTQTAPRVTHLMEQTAGMNHINLLDAADRKLLAQLLQTIREKAPVLHISFSAEPNEAFNDKLMAWLRREIHPLVLMTAGLQPNIGAGCIVRSTNHYFDCSLRQNFKDKKELLMAQLLPEEQVA